MRRILRKLSGLDRGSNINLHDEELLNESEEFEEE